MRRLRGRASLARGAVGGTEAGGDFERDGGPARSPHPLGKKEGWTMSQSVSSARRIDSVVGQR